VNAGLLATVAFFAGNATRTTELLAVVPEPHRRNLRVLAAATFHSLWVTTADDAAESDLADVVATGDRDALHLALTELQVFHSASTPTATATPSTRGPRSRAPNSSSGGNGTSTQNCRSSLR
jgi:hypothetical protein